MFQSANKYIPILALFFLTQCENWHGKKTDNYVKENFKTYEATYVTILDSMRLYGAALLKYYTFFDDNIGQIDSMVCINSRNDLLVTTINVSSGTGEDGKSDITSKILGKKINNHWYFLSGENLIVPRHMYDKDEMHPLSMHELSQIARKEMLESALIKNDEGKYVVDDKWIDAHFYNNGYYFIKNPKISGVVSPGEEFQMPRDKHIADSMHWDHIMDKWKHKIDTNEYKPLKRFKKDKPVS